MDYLTRYYKNLSEQLEAKYRRLLNEVESPFQVDSPLSADGPGADPNTRNIASVEAASDSVRLQLPPFNPNNKVWRQSWQGYNNPNNPPWNNWASFLNGLYQNWNNNAWWFDSQFADLIYVIYGDDYNYQWNSNGTFQLTEEMKLNAWNCLQNMMIAGSQATSLQNSRGAASTVLGYYQRQVGNYSGVQDYYSNFSIYVANYWFGGQGQQLTQFPPTQPWNSPPGYIPFPGAPVYGNNFAAIQTASTSTPSQPNSPSNRPRRPTESFGPGPGRGRRPTKGSQGRPPSYFGGGAGGSAPR